MDNISRLFTFGYIWRRADGDLENVVAIDHTFEIKTKVPNASLQSLLFGQLIIPYRPKLWIHGHDHGCHDYQVAETRIFSNQAGYPRVERREVSGFRPDCVIEVGALTG